jgi:hypothetical protein
VVRGQATSMTKILVGSQAIKHWFSDFSRTPKDFDYISDEPKAPGEDSHWNDGVAALAAKYPDPIACPDALATLKYSHAFWQIGGPENWKKHMFDYWFLTTKKGAKVDMDLFPALYDAFTKIHGPKRAKLSEQNEMFFKKTVERKYVHDSLHEAMKFYDEPMFQKIKVDKSKAAVSRKMFEELSHEDQLKCALEEIYVVALERFLIPADFKMHPKSARQEALRLLITSMTKGFFAEFMVTNWNELFVANNDNSFVERFRLARDEGRLILEQ